MIKFSLQLKTWQYCNTSILIAAISSYEQVSTLMSDYSAKSQIKNAAHKSRTILRPAIQNECGNTMKALSSYWTDLNLTNTSQQFQDISSSHFDGMKIISGGKYLCQYHACEGSLCGFLSQVRVFLADWLNNDWPLDRTHLIITGRQL